MAHKWRATSRQAPIIARESRHIGCDICSRGSVEHGRTWIRFRRGGAKRTTGISFSYHVYIGAPCGIDRVRDVDGEYVDGTDTHAGRKGRELRAAAESELCAVGDPEPGEPAVLGAPEVIIHGAVRYRGTPEKPELSLALQFVMRVGYNIIRILSVFAIVEVCPGQVTRRGYDGVVGAFAGDNPPAQTQ